MKLIIRLSVVTVLTFSIAWMLSWLPQLHKGSMRASGDLTVFRSIKPIELSESNLVDWVMNMPMKLDLNKVDWNHRMIALDFALNGPLTLPEDVYAQLMDAVFQGLGNTTNVERVMIRVYDQSSKVKSKHHLLLALDAAREQFKLADYEQVRDKKVKPEMWLDNQFELRQTIKWKEWLSDRISTQLKGK